MAPPDKVRLQQKHRLAWHGTWIWFGFFLAFAIAEAALAWSLAFGHPLLAAGLVLVLAHVMHTHLIAFHEAAHSTLCPNRRLNDVIGTIIGFFSLMSLSLYRSAHHFHHAYLSTERDEELWPFVIPTAPRWFRCMMAACELALGLFYTPLLFLRTLLRDGSPITSHRVRRRVWAELAFNASLWGIVLGATCWLGAWRFLAILYLAPALLAGAMQSFRKYVEHMGLTGATVLGSTRSVITPGLLGRSVAFTLFNEPFHGVHHRYARLPHTVLPEFDDLLVPELPEEPAPFPTYRAALWDMLASLPDPKVGAQWLSVGNCGAPPLKPMRAIPAEAGV